MSQLGRRQTLRLLAAFGAAGAAAPLLSACSSNEQGSTSTGAGNIPVKVGLVVPQSGANQALGKEISNGFNLYLKAHKSRLSGHTIEVIATDEGNDPKSGKAAAEKLVQQQQVAVLTGVSNAETLNAVKDVAESSQVPLITGSPSTFSLQGTKYVWRTAFVTDEPGRALGKWVADHANGPVYVLAEDFAGARDDVKGFVDALKGAGGAVEGQPVYTSRGAKDYTAELSTLRASAATAVFCLYSGSVAVEFVKQLRKAGFPDSLQVYAPGTLTEGPALNQLGEGAKGIYTAMNYSADLDNARNRAFVSEYQKEYGAAPSTYAVTAYDAAVVLGMALELAGTDVSSLGINTAMGHVGQIDSPRGSWQFNQTRAPLQKWYLRQVRPDGPVLANVLTAELMTLGADQSG